MRIIRILLAAHFAYALREFECDPCIDRSDYTIKVLWHGTSSDGFWQNVKAAAFQAGYDLGITLDLALYEGALRATMILRFLAQLTLRLARRLRP